MKLLAAAQVRGVSALGAGPDRALARQRAETEVTLVLVFARLRRQLVRRGQAAPAPVLRRAGRWRSCSSCCCSDARRSSTSRRWRWRSSSRRSCRSRSCGTGARRVDYQQIAVLAFLHLIAATVLSTNLTLRGDLRRLRDRHAVDARALAPAARDRRQLPAAERRRTRARAGAIARVLASRRVVGPQFLVGTALLAVPLFAMTLAIFVIDAARRPGLLELQPRRGQRVAGFGNQIELGGFGVIRDDPTVVLRVMPLPSVERRRRACRCACAARRSTTTTASAGRARRACRSCLRRASRRTTLIRCAASTTPARDKQLQIVLDHLDEPVGVLAVRHGRADRAAAHVGGRSRSRAS